MTRRTAAAVTACALLAALLPSATAAAQPHRDSLQGDVDAIRATGATGVLAEVRTSSGGHAARAGVADLRTGRPVPWNSYFRIGSDTKTYTSVVALQLVGEGKLQLTDTVEKWLPGLVRGKGNDGRKITVKNLLRHTSGLNDYVAVELGDGSDWTPEKYRENRFRVSTPQEKVATAMTRPPQWVPNTSNPAEETRWGYSNTNYVLAGLIIEKVTGRSWEQQVHERIIEPLGLRHTITPGTSAYVPQPSATAYTRFPGRKDLTDTSINVGAGPEGGIIGTPHDHATFLRALLGGRLLRPAQLAQMKQTVPVDDWIPADGVRYGLGLAWRPVRNCTGGVWFHGGTSYGVISESGASADGRRAASVAVSTFRPGDPAQDAQDKASLRLVDKAVCGTG
ncbi:D-alanyl-D-alanine carboxypeptidase [Actinomadura pelletieri DSM 43383]|uniref:D-alanyl-D-alanine carboxypeptidase n=1 Tax=Actinomadura pelletieri DSM 43383 TaxID=1120940 RepID=A0A495QXB6_9ACTN|nr:serine hydrolase domain-containing protein [Actinomadura pelletieri]RKS78760.1 D-alanyl-D-alanine carboxypeptidase [Actinomadura pelletieri DSM 43383]